MIEHGRVSVDNRGDHEEGIKDADAQKIPSRPEMRHPLLFGRVIDACVRLFLFLRMISLILELTWR